MTPGLLAPSYIEAGTLFIDPGSQTAVEMKHSESQEVVRGGHTRNRSKIMISLYLRPDDYLFYFHYLYGEGFSTARTISSP